MPKHYFCGCCGFKMQLLKISSTRSNSLVNECRKEMHLNIEGTTRKQLYQPPRVILGWKKCFHEAKLQQTSFAEIDNRSFVAVITKTKFTFFSELMMTFLFCCAKVSKSSETLPTDLERTMKQKKLCNYQQSLSRILTPHTWLMVSHTTSPLSVPVGTRKGEVSP